MKEKLCPICQEKLVKKGRSYLIKELLGLWRPVTFSQKTIRAHLKQSQKTSLYFCSNCLLEIYLPQVIGNEKFYTEAYNLMDDNESTSTYSAAKWDFQEATQDLRKNDSILDIGCGPGNFLMKAKPLVKKVYGTEYNHSARIIAQAKGLKVFKPNEVMKLNERFDKVFSFHVLEHVADPMKFIEQMVALTKPGGEIGISVPNQNGPVKYIIPCASNMPPHHATHWHLSTLLKMAETLNLEVVRFAFEPLNKRDIYYYSTHWVNYKFSGDTWVRRQLHRWMGKIVRFFFLLLFDILYLFGQKTTPLFKGQSVYVLMLKK